MVVLGRHLRAAPGTGAAVRRSIGESANLFNRLVWWTRTNPLADRLIRRARRVNRMLAALYPDAHSD